MTSSSVKHLSVEGLGSYWLLANRSQSAAVRQGCPLLTLQAYSASPEFLIGGTTNTQLKDLTMGGGETGTPNNA